MATAVEIKIMVDPSNTAPAIDGIQQKLNEMGVAGQVSVRKVGEGMDQMKGHVSTSLDSVRLLSQEFGLRLPRAIESMLSRVPAVTSALSSMVGAMAALAGLEIAFHVGEEIYKAFDLGGERAKQMQADVNDANIALRRMNDEVELQIQKLNQEHAVFEHRPSNGMALALAEASARADEFASKMEGVDSKIQKAIADMGNQGGFSGAISWLFTGASKTSYEQTMLGEHQRHMAIADSPDDQKKEIESYIASLQTRLSQLKDTNWRAQFSPNTNWTNEINAASQLLQFAKKEQTDQQKDTDLDGAQQRKQRDDEAKVAMQQQKQAIREVAQLQAEADEAGLTGDALRNQKKLDEIAQVSQKLRDLHATQDQLAAASAAISKKYDDDEIARKQKLLDDAQKALRDAQSAGLSGLPAIRARRNSGLADIDAEKDTPDNVKVVQRQRVNLVANQEEGSYWQQNDEDEAAKMQQQADEQLRIQQENLRYDQQAADAEKRIHEDGALGWVASYKNAISAIQDQETQRLAKVQEDAQREGLSYEDAARRREDVEREANAEIAQQQQQLQHQVSGLLEQAFRDPIGTIKSQMEKLMFDILAQWLLQLHAFQAIFGSTLGGLTPGGTGSAAGPGGFAGAIANAVGGHAATAGGSGTGAQISAQSAAARPSYSRGIGSIPLSGSEGQLALSAISGAGSLFGGSSSSDGGIQPIDTPSTGYIDQEAMPTWTAPSDGTIQPIDTPSTGSIPSQQPDTPYSVPSMDSSTSLGTAMGFAGAAAGAYMGEQSTVNAFKKGSPISGALGDMAAGAAIGSVIPGIGTAVGAAVGAIVGLGSGITGMILGEGGRLAARDYYTQSIFPQLEAERLGQGGDAVSAYSDVNKISVDGMNYMAAHWGSGAALWVKSNYLDKEVKLALSQITQHAEGGAQYTQMQAMQFHTGGYVGGFGDMGTSSTEGYIHALLGESVVNTRATAMHAPVINAMNNGASPTDVASMYLRGSRSSSTTSASSGGDTHFHIHTLDTQTMTGWLRSGGARMISKEQNNLAARYAGDGQIG